MEYAEAYVAVLDDDELTGRIEEIVTDLLDTAESHYKRPIEDLTIRYDLRGVRAGQANRDTIWLNPILLLENKEEMLTQTVPHEVAHCVQRQVWNHRTGPHGREWREVMFLFGCQPDARHSMDTSNAKTRKTYRIPAKCDCRTHWLTLYRANKYGTVRDGIRHYDLYCKFCSGAVRGFEGDEEMGQYM